jgi:hypothetical protein
MIDDVVDPGATAIRVSGNNVLEVGGRPNQIPRALSVSNRMSRGRLFPIGEGPISEIVAGTIRVNQETELPQLVGNVLAGVGDGSVGPHQDLVGVVHVRELRTCREGHDPAAGVFPVLLEADGTGLPEQFEGPLPETEVEDVGLMRQKIVGHSETGHGCEVAANVAFGHRRGNSRDRSTGKDLASDNRALHQLQCLVDLEVIVAFLDDVQDFGTVGGEVGFLLVTGGYPRVHPPAEVVEIGGRCLRDIVAWSLRQCEFDQLVTSSRLDPKCFGKIGFGQEEETDHDVRHLNAGVIDVVLNLDLVSEIVKTSDQDITQNRISQVSYVGSLIGVDVGVFDDGLAGGPRVFTSLTAQKTSQNLASIEEDIEKPGARNLHPIYLLGPLTRGGNRLGDLPRSLSELPCKGQCPGPREIPEVAPRRHLEGHRLRAISELALERRGQCLGGARAD